MYVECELVLKVVKPVKALVYDNIRDYVGTIKKYDENLRVLRENLSDVCNKKDNIMNKVNEGKGNQHEITREADSWLKVVRTLAGDEKLKSLMYEDVETAKIVMRLMGKNDLKKLVRHDSEMQNLAVKVMNKLKEEMENSMDEDRLIATVDYNMIDYKMVAEVVVEVMKDTTEEFKKLMKNDKKMAVIATRMLIDTDLDKLTKDDMEMEDIVREARSVSDKGLGQHGAEESSVLPVPGVDANTVQEAVYKLLLPLGNLFPIIGELMNDSVLKNALPKAEDVKFSWDVINGLLLKNRAFKKAMEENIRQHESCSCLSVFALSHYRNQHKMSIAAVTTAERIKKDMIDTCQGLPLTFHTRSFDLKNAPIQFLKSLQSRQRLLKEILQILRDDQVGAVGIFGMGGCGKTTLAKEVVCKCDDMVCILVEITESPDIKRIQGAIAESIDLKLHDVQSLVLRAKKLYNRLTSEKEKKILIILDNIWEKLNLEDVGIPDNCKLLLTTREKEVCGLMGVRDDYTRKVELLNGIEDRELFRRQVGDKGDSEEYKTVTNRLLSKCGGLPLTIAVTAKALKDKDLSYWRKFANELEKPTSSQLASGHLRATYSILATSYRFMESKEKRMFFILCCMWCFDTDIPIKTVMRYGIGLDLFQYVSKLSEAMDQANIWADELVSSSMLLKSNRRGFIKIHDVVRAFGISFAAKDEHKLLVDAIPRWMNNETLMEYTAICLLSDNAYSGLTGMVSDKLQILLLECTKIPDSPSSFSGRMLNLKVLYLGNMNFHLKLPESIGKLVKLRTLSLEKCKLGDIKVIGELVNLCVLSFLGSHIEELPNDIGKLINLRLLDLTDCNFKFPPDLSNILGGLSELEGLFMRDIFKRHIKYNGDGIISYAPLLAIEFNNLHYLNALEMQIWCAQQLSIDSQFVKNLDSFRIHVCYRWLNLSGSPDVGYFRRILHIEEVDMGEYLGDNTLKSLLKKADWLKLSYASNFGILFNELHNEGLPELRYLDVVCCKDVAFIFNLKENLLVFPNLHTLILDDVPELKGFCDWEDSPGLFTNLQDLSLIRLSDLQYVLPFGRAPRKLTTLKVMLCESLKFIFTENASVEKEETDVMELPFLKSLDLLCLDNLVSLLGSENLSGNVDGVQEHQVLFNPRIVFSALEEFELINCKRIVKLWDKELGISSLRRLTKMYISDCEELSSLGSLSIFSTLVQLERLTITECESMHEVITSEGTEESEEHEVITSEGTEESEERDQEFTQLMDLFISRSGKLKSFYGGRCKLKFPKLKRLRLFDLDCLNKFAGSENQSFLFQKEMDFPCLEELQVLSVNDEVMGLWDWGHLEGGNTLLSNPVPMLRTLRLDIKGCSQMPLDICKNLYSLAFEMCDDEVLLSLGNERSVWTYSQLPKLKDLCVSKSRSLKDLLRTEDFNVAAALTFCKQLVNLNLSHLPRLKMFPLHLFKSLCSLVLVGLSWEYAFSAGIFVRLQDSLQHLETLVITDCKNMRVVIQGDGEGDDAGLIFKFPRLRRMSLSSSSIIGFSTTTNATLRIPFLKSIYVYECDMMQHFWSGPIIAPKLEAVHVNKCKTMKSVLVGNPNHMVELPSLMSVELSDCPAMLCFSSGPLRAPNLDDAEWEWKKYFMADFGMNLNHFLRSRHDIDYSEEPSSSSISQI